MPGFLVHRWSSYGTASLEPPNLLRRQRVWMCMLSWCQSISGVPHARRAWSLLDRTSSLQTRAHPSVLRPSMLAVTGRYAPFREVCPRCVPKVRCNGHEPHAVCSACYLGRHTPTHPTTTPRQLVHQQPVRLESWSSVDSGPYLIVRISRHRRRRRCGRAGHPGGYSFLAKVNKPSCSSTWMVSPSWKPPSSSFMASWFWSCCWMTLLTGRAPSCGS